MHRVQDGQEAQDLPATARSAERGTGPCPTAASSPDPSPELNSDPVPRREKVEAIVQLWMCGYRRAAARQGLQWIGNTVHRAARPHACEVCHGGIRPGELYRRRVGLVQVDGRRVIRVVKIHEVDGVRASCRVRPKRFQVRIDKTGQVELYYRL